MFRPKSKWFLGGLVWLALAPGLAFGQSAELLKANNQAMELFFQGRYSDALPLAIKALDLGEGEFGSDHPTIADLVDDLAQVHFRLGHYSDAEPLFKRALKINEGALGAEHPDVAKSLNNLALLYEAQGHYALAEPLYKRSLAISEKALGPEHPDVGQGLSNLAGLYQAQGWPRSTGVVTLDRLLAVRQRVLPVVLRSRTGQNSRHASAIVVADASGPNLSMGRPHLPQLRESHLPRIGVSTEPRASGPRSSGNMSGVPAKTRLSAESPGFSL